MAPNTTNYAQIQEDEITSLRSIYMDDFVEEAVKTGAWNKILERSFTITLRADSHKELKAVINVRFTFPSTYPKSVPVIQVKSVQNVRNETMQQVLSVVHERPKDLVGNEMVFALATELQEVLDAAPIVDPQDVPTLDEERKVRALAAQAKIQEEEESQRLKAAHTEAEEDTQEKRQVLEDLEAQHKERTNKQKSIKNSTLLNQALTYEQIPGVVRFDRSSRLEVVTEKTLGIEAVHDKVHYRQGPLGSIYTVQPWTRAQEKRADDVRIPPQAPFLLLKEYFIKSQSDDETVKKSIQNLESLLDQQTWTHKPHQHVISPANFVIERTEKASRLASPDEVGWKISVLIPFAKNGSLLNLLDVAVKVDTERIQVWSIQILEGLGHFHRHGTAHANIHLNNILLDQGEARNVIARLTDAGYVYKLHQLKAKSTAQSLLPEPWKAPEGDEGVCKPPSDIWYFGVCLLQMGFGKDVVNQYHSPVALLDDLELSKPFAAVVRKIFNPRPKKRPSAWELIHFEFFRDDETSLLQPHGNNDLDSAITSPNTTYPRTRRRSSAMPVFSRYAKDFVEEGRLGHGGFGEVFKARNRTDGQPYAIKKIKAKSKAALDPVLSEASVLSRLNHPNVVRYYTSWIEEDTKQKPGNKFSSKLELGSSIPSDHTQTPVLPQSSKVSSCATNYVVSVRSSQWHMF